MASLTPSRTIVISLIFIDVLFIIQSFYGYWQLYLAENKPDVHPNVLFSFTLLLTIVTIIATWLYLRYNHVDNRTNNTSDLEPPTEYLLDSNIVGGLSFIQ